ncbi:hypothetical protein GURKE_00990 [Brevundimonas phage vB_BpoS-Gurke]|uniref:Uncharacterized protein n=1 Tax=Brevundimonas phage vB_BpoS-Gurke TaxID=2948599 RepID=A0A9E7SSN3_9CAUD|nr:hypothetical protein GURKE_00990 [Brevundimonas phage vB_BpoS-Gurke]
MGKYAPTLAALTDIQRAQLLQARRDGATYSELGRIYGYEQTTIRGAVRAWDPELARKTAKAWNPEWTERRRTKRRSEHD